MERYSLLIDPSLCIGCQACEVACKQANNLPVGPKFMRVITVGPLKRGEKLEMSFVPMACMHCADAPCISACPEGAITRRADGIVLINESSCIGCKYCMEFCPFGALQFNDTKGVVEKCTLCVERLDKGLKPMCELHCPTRAISSGDINELSELKRQQRAKRNYFSVEGEY